MTTWISLLRGINVGGNNKLPMADLKIVLNNIGFKNIRTYIQSGNCVFETKSTKPEKISDEISKAIKTKFGFSIQVMTISVDDFATTLTVNPYIVDEPEENTVHFNFLAATSLKPDLNLLEQLRGPTETFVLKDKVFYLHAPDGIGRSKLATSAEKCLGVPTTGRNLRSVKKILSLAVDG